MSQSHIHLEAPHLQASIKWRSEQGRDEVLAAGSQPDAVDSEKIADFLQLFERVARLERGYETEFVAFLNEAHCVERIERRTRDGQRERLL